MSGELLIRGARLLCPFTGRDEMADVLVSGGKVHAIGGVKAEGAAVLEAAGLVLTPGFIDLHVHLREPGREDEETIASGTAAALAGGFTTICCMPNTEPAIDCVSVAESVLERARAAGQAEVLVIGAVTRGRAGRELAELGSMHKRCGVTMFSDDGACLADAALLRRAMEYVGMFGGTVISHCEDAALARGGQMHEGKRSTSLGLRGIPASAEEVMVARDIRIAAMTGGRLHIAHVSCAGSLELIRQAKREGVRVTAEATPHHLAFCEDDLASYDTAFKVSPPLRTSEDRDALRQALLDGTIDAIATDHAPHSSEEKETEFELAPCGTLGMESAWGALQTWLVEPQLVSLDRLVSLLTAGPAAVLGWDASTRGLREGAAADLVLLDTALEHVIDSTGFKSLSRNCAFDGRKVRGGIAYTLKGGKTKYTAPGRERPARSGAAT
ncbi:MAG: dihydroorotase [Candidatus Geothermincolia bacterium]